MIKTLKDVLAVEFMGIEYENDRARKYADMQVVREHQFGWPGKHKNVVYWCELENGLAVGWNENPARGWSFPVHWMK